MDFDTLDRRISDLTSALGDPTRRAIYIAVRESAEPLTTTGVAQIFKIHPNVARHHLDILVDEGFIRVSDRRPKGQTAGRPAKFRASDLIIAHNKAPACAGASCVKQSLIQAQ